MRVCRNRVTGTLRTAPTMWAPLRSCGKLAHVTLTIALLGAPRIEVDGAPLRVDTRKAVALLAFLAVTGHAHSRDRLTALLWPEYDDDRARAALRRTLSTLKTAVGRRLAAHRPGDRRARCRGCRRRHRALPCTPHDARGRTGRDRGAHERGRAASRRSARRLRAARQRRVRQLAGVDDRRAAPRARLGARSARRRARRRRPLRRGDTPCGPPAGARSARRARPPPRDRALRRHRQSRRGAAAVPRVRPRPRPRAGRAPAARDDRALPGGERGTARDRAHGGAAAAAAASAHAGRAGPRVAAARGGIRRVRAATVVS